MTQVYEGSLDGKRLRVAVIASRFNETISKRLLEGALDGLRRHGVAEADISVAWVPGAFELPATARRFASSGEVDAVTHQAVAATGQQPFRDEVVEASAGHGNAQAVTA